MDAANHALGAFSPKFADLHHTVLIRRVCSSDSKWRIGADFELVGLLRARTRNISPDLATACAMCAQRGSETGVGCQKRFQKNFGITIDRAQVIACTAEQYSGVRGRTQPGLIIPCLSLNVLDVLPTLKFRTLFP